MISTGTRILVHVPSLTPSANVNSCGGCLCHQIKYFKINLLIDLERSCQRTKRKKIFYYIKDNNKTPTMEPTIPASTA